MEQALATGNLSWVYTELGLYKLARTGLEQSQALSEAVGSRRYRAYDRFMLA